MISDVLNFLRKPATSAEALRAKLADVTNALPEAGATVSRLATERAAKLLDATDRELEAIERAEADARRAVDRLRAASEELTRRLAVAEAEEARAALDADREAAERQAEATADRVRKEYARAAKTIAALVADLDVAEKAVAAINSRLIEAGRGDEALPEVEERALPAPEGLLAAPWRLRNAASLPPCAGFEGLGRAREAGGWAGVVRDQLG